MALLVCVSVPMESTVERMTPAVPLIASILVRPWAMLRLPSCSVELTESRPVRVMVPPLLTRLAALLTRSAFAMVPPSVRFSAA